MNKGLKHLAAGAALAISPVSHHLKQLNIPPTVVTPSAQAGKNLAGHAQDNTPIWDKQKTLKAISMQESNGGKNTNHAEIKHGLSAGTHAHGQYGLTDDLIRNVIQRSPRLSEKHSGVLTMDDQHIDEYLKHNPDLENEVASRYHDRITKELGAYDPRTVYHAWLNGTAGTKKYLETHKIEEHPLANKVFDYYNKIK